MQSSRARKHIIRIRQGIQEKSFTVDQDEIVVGRAENSGIRIGSKAVSDRHLLIKIDGDQVKIRDLKSEHGTFVGGRKISPDELHVLRSPEEECHLGNIISVSITPGVAASQGSVREQDLEEATLELRAARAAGGGGAGSLPYRPAPRHEAAPLKLVSTPEKHSPDPLTEAPEMDTAGEGALRFSEAIREEGRRKAQSIIAAAEAKRREIEEEKLKVKEELGRMNLRLETLRIDKGKLEQEVLESRLHLESIAEAIAELDLKKDQYGKSLIDTQNRRMAVEREISGEHSRLASLCEQIQAKEAEVRAHAAEITRLQETMTELRQTIVETREVLHAEREAINLELRTHRARHETLHAEFRAKQMALEGNLAQLEIQKSTSEHELREALEKKAAILYENEKINRACEIDCNQARERLTSLEIEAQRMAEKIEGQRKTHELLRIDINERQAILTNLATEREKMVLEVTLSREKLEQSLASLTELKKAMEFEVGGLKTEIEGLALRREEVLKENDRLIGDRARQSEEALARLREVENECMEFKSQLDIDREESQKFRSQVEKSQETLASLEEQRNQVYSMIEASEDQARKLSQEISELSSKRDVLSFQVEEGKKRLEFEMDTRQKASIAEMENELRLRKEQAEREFASTRAGFDSEMEAFRKSEAQKFEKLQDEAQAAERARRSYVLNEIIVGTLELAKKAPLADSENQLRDIVQAALEGKSSAALSAKADARTRRFWKKVGLIMAAPATITLILVIFPDLPTQLQHRLERKVAAEKKESGGVFLEEIRQRGQTFQPEKMDQVYRSSYSDNIIYLESYVGLKTNAEKQKEWTLILNDFFVGRLGLSDRVIPDFIATESVMIKELQEIRQGIVLQFKDQGLQRMADTEKKNLAKILQLLESDENYKKFRALEKSFYEDYMRSKTGAQTSTPPSASPNASSNAVEAAGIATAPSGSAAPSSTP